MNFSLKASKSSGSVKSKHIGKKVSGFIDVLDTSYFIDLESPIFVVIEVLFGK